MSEYIKKHFDRYHGQHETREKWQSIDAKGDPIPWITYGALFQLEQFEYANCDIFEWGSGFSSLYWASRCREIISIEHDSEWIDFVRNKPQTNLTCHAVNLNEYAAYIDRFERNFDVIVIDGYIHENMRMECTRHAISHLRAGGLIVLDNSDWLPNTCALLRSQGFNQNDYAGFGPINNYPWCTSLFFKGTLDIPRRQPSPGFLLGGIQNSRD